MSARSGVRLPLAVIGVAVAVAGCSSAPASPPAATQILAAMKAAYARATSARIATDFGQPGRPEPFDLAMTRSDDMTGLYSHDGVTTTIIVTRGKTYVLLNPAYYRYLVKQGNALSAPCSAICGRYVTGKLVRPPLQGFFSSYLRYFPLTIDVTDKTRVTAVTYHGQAAYKFADTEGDEIYISKGDYPYPIAIVGQGHTMRLSEWNAVPPITAPPAAQVITSSSLFAGG